MDENSLDELYRVLQDFDSAMLVTRSTEHQLHARPMELQDPSQLPDCDLWFATAADTAKVDEIVEEQQVNVCCLRARDGAYLSISARARISTDANEIRRLYQPSWRIWMGDDGTHPAVLLKLTIERAEYWAPEGGLPRLLYEAVEGALTEPVTVPDR